MKDYAFLLFDADYTLMDFERDMRFAFEQTYRACGFDRIIPYSGEMLDTYERHNLDWWARFERHECEKSQLFRGRFEDFLTETGLSADPDEMNNRYFGFLALGGAVYPGAVELLAALAPRYRIYITTNGNAKSSLSRLENSGLRPYVSRVFVSEEVGVGKPHRRYFRYVSEQIEGWDPDRALVIGDSLSSDILGANNFGLDSVWYWPEPVLYHQEDPGNIPCTWRIKSYDELRNLLLPQLP